MKEQTTFYVSLKDPVEIRKNILESSKGIIQLLQRYDHIVELKNNRLHKIAELRKIAKELARLAGQLKMALPSVDSIERESKREASKVEKEIKTKQKEIKEKPKPVLENRKTSELKKLESELLEIENKLKNLS
ncbi:MAG: hypothetical protein Q8O89_03720 [Nanoarchaeota archaeon]|nr:hypothetical protein [Nanoarchaeota archaeon]